MSARDDEDLRPRWLGVLRAVVLGAAALLVAILLSGLWRLELVSGAGRAAISGYVIVGIAAPDAALLLLAAALPITSMVGLLLGVSLTGPAFAEALALSLLFGRAIRALVSPGPRLALDRAGIAAMVVAGIAAASALAFLPVLHARTGTNISFAAALMDWISRDYFLRSSDMRPIHDAALLCESAVLFIAARRTSTDPAFRVSLLRMLAAGAVAAAAFNIVRLATVALRTESFGSALLFALQSFRINVHHADLNAAGSFFALFVCVAVGLARGRQGWWAWPAAGTLALALWMAGSRSAMAALAIAAFAVFTWPALRGHRGSSRGVAMGLAVLTAAVATTVVLLWPRSAANMAMRPALAYRLELWNAARRMISEHPIVGVGIAQFLPLSSRYRPPVEGAVLQVPENAHNNLLQIAAELGLPGLIGFLTWVLFGSAPLVRRLVAGEATRLEAALLTGLTAFALTWLVGHPLLLPTVAFPFWLALAAAGPDTALRLERPIVRRWLVPAAAALLVVSVPFRAATAFGGADFEHVASGFSAWLDGPDGVKYRRAANCSGIYVPSNAASVIVPARAGRTVSGPLTVAFSVDGRDINAFQVDASGWIPLRVRLPAPQTSGRFRFLSLRVRNGEDGSCDDVRLNVAKVTAFDDRGSVIQ